MLNILFKLLDKREPELPLPQYMTPHSAGMDICSSIDFSLSPRKSKLIPTGFAMELPPGFEAQIRPRSGLATKHGVTVINSPGTIDADYRGEIRIGLINLGDRVFRARRGDRIAQMVVQQVFKARIELVKKLNQTSRNSGGFGSTGT